MSPAAVPMRVPVTLVTESMFELFSVVEAERNVRVCGSTVLTLKLS